MRKVTVAIIAGLTLGISSAQTSKAKIHRLEATPATVAYGYYWSEAKPALRIASGDIIDVDTLLTNSPAGLARAGVPDNKIQESLKAIVNELTGDRQELAMRAGHRPVPPFDLTPPKVAGVRVTRAF